MKLKILNKNNLINPELPLDSKYAVSNLKEFEIVEGSVYKKNYNETLDSYIAKITNLSVRIDIEPYDEVVLTDTNTNSVFGVSKSYTMLVDTYHETMVSVNPKIYDYEIYLFSKTKLLEGAICPNLAITPSRTDDKRSIYFYISEYMRLYCPKKRIKVNGSIEYQSIIKVPSDGEFTAKFADSAPELQWNTPNLREVLNDLFIIKDCIPIVNADNELDFLDLTKENNDITNEPTINYIERSQSSEDYVSEIQMNMQNVMNTSIDGVKNTVTTCERLAFNAENYLVNSDNVLLKTNYPILRVKHLWLYYVGVLHSTAFDDSGNFTIMKADLCDLQGNNFVKEKDEYETLPVIYRVGDIPSSISDKANTQNYCIYYTRYTNQISGFTSQTRNSPFLWFETGVTNTIQLLKQLAAETATNLPPDFAIISDTNTKPINSYFSSFFQIEYETTTESVFRAAKADKPANNRIIIDNQTNSFVDAYTQGKLEYQKANRLGNPMLNINQRTLNSGERLIDIGDYYIDGIDKYIIYSVEYQIYKDHTEVNAAATKDYILKNYFVGVKQKVRTWVNAKDEALERHDIEKVYCEFAEEAGSYDDGEQTLITDLLSPILTNETETHPIKHCNVYTMYGGNRYPNDIYYYYSLECLARIIGNSIVLTTGFRDNYTVSVTPDTKALFPNGSTEYIKFVGADVTFPVVSEDITKATNTGGYGGVPLANNKYVYDNGNFDRIVILYNDYVTDELSNNYGAFTNATVTSTTLISANVYHNYFDLDTENYSLFHEAVLQSKAYCIVNGEYKLVYNDSTGYYFTAPTGYTSGKRITAVPIVYQYAEDKPGTEEIKEWFKQSCTHPIELNSEHNGTRAAVDVEMLKDNKEIIRNSLQLEFCTSSRNIYFTKYYIQLVNIVREIERPRLRFFVSDTYLYNSEKLPDGIGTGEFSGYVDRVSDNRYKIYNAPENRTAYYITDNNGNVLLGMKGITEFIFKKKKIRDDNIYNENNIIIDKV